MLQSVIGEYRYVVADFTQRPGGFELVRCLETCGQGEVHFPNALAATGQQCRRTCYGQQQRSAGVSVGTGNTRLRESAIE